jgi:hypothetical protein
MHVDLTAGGRVDDRLLWLLAYLHLSSCWLAGWSAQVPFVGVRRARGAGEMHVVVVDVDARTVAVSAPCTVHAQLAVFLPPALPVLYVGAHRLTAVRPSRPVVHAAASDRPVQSLGHHVGLPAQTPPCPAITIY